MKKKHVFAGAAAKRAYFLGSFDSFLVARCIPKIPSWIETYHLTGCTLLFSILIFVFSYFVQFSQTWFMAIALVFAAQYLTDLFDGALGRYRNTGLVKWGFLMDHFLDFIFMSAFVVGTVMYVPTSLHVYVYILQVAWSGMMINSLLYFAATNHFKISYGQFGPSEYRVFMIFILFGAFIFGQKVFEYVLPILSIISFIVLMGVVYGSHQDLWKLDMKVKTLSLVKKSKAGR